MIKIICHGKIKEDYLNKLIEDYKKRISKYHKLEIIELKDYQDSDIKTALKKEEELIKKHLKETDNIVLNYF